jgi:secondary thiamine-phosphate synthase enzyme
MIQQVTFTLPKYTKGFHLITTAVIAELDKLPEAGILHLFIQHTSAALAIGENADPTVRQDLDQAFDRIAPEEADYLHDDEGADDMPAHIKTILTGNSISVPITAGKLSLGRWQGIYLCEFRERGTPRTLVASIVT